MPEMKFDDQVAVVTGAGAAAGLGRVYALLLASRGAKVVVNDLGTGPDGRGIARASAQNVVDEIRKSGGEAVADTNSVADEESARAIIRTALDNYGRVDILINNAGVFRPADFASLTSDDITQIASIHFLGTIWMCRAVWPYMLEQKSGRIVNVSSVAMWGAQYTVLYGSAKAGILGLTRGLAVEGASSNVRVNALAPIAATTALHYFNKLESNPMPTNATVPPNLTPEVVAPVVAYLCHSDCLLNGAYVATGGGHVALGVFGTTRGYDCGMAITPEDVKANLAAIADPTDFSEFPSGNDILEVQRSELVNQ